jgi:hypothetical protein
MSAWKRLWSAVAAVSLLALAAGSVEARPISPAEERDQPYSGIVPPCQDQISLSVIQSHFAQRESEYWHSGLAIAAFEDVREVGFRSNGLDYIPRRYCQARVVMNDQKIRTVNYSLVEAGGGIGFEDGVVFCVIGLDRFDAFAPACKEALP